MNEMREVYGVWTICGDSQDLWMRVGSAFLNDDGSLDIKLEALPLDGRLHIRRLEDTDDAHQTT